MNLFTSEGFSNTSLTLHRVFPMVSVSTMEALLAPFTKKDIKEAVFAMAPYKTPGSDGFHAGFY